MYKVEISKFSTPQNDLYFRIYIHLLGFTLLLIRVECDFEEPCEAKFAVQDIFLFIGLGN